MSSNNQASATREHKPGTLISARGREWIVLPQEDHDPQVLMVKPLGGSDAEKTGLLLDLEGEIKSYELPLPSTDTLHAFENAKLLFHATRLSFRNASGPFRCMARLSFRPRPYQMVPLLMALQQEQPTRLMIADDVGVGKTVEALLIVKEWLERGEVDRFAIICPPHLCDQWQRELLDKVGIEATIIRSSSLGKLERQLHGDQSVFEAFPYQIVSIDYIKGDKRRGLFLQQAPEMIVLDEAHTCARPAHEGDATKDQMQKQRFYLIDQLAQDPERHLLLLTATPHSGKETEFRSLLGLLKPELATLDIGKGQRKNREELAKYFVQRKRKDLLRWMQQDTHFAERETKEIGVSLSPEYQRVYQEMVRFILKETRETTHRAKKWGALTLLRGVMSSPLAGARMLQNRLQKMEGKEAESEARIIPDTPYNLDSDREDEPNAFTISQSHAEWLRPRIEELQRLQTPQLDQKLKRTIDLTRTWVKNDVYPIIFCQFIATAQYVGDQLRQALPDSVTVEVITSEQADEQRKERIHALGQQPRRVLVCTDCLSEGINLQEHFTAVVHYDLPWNPNRLEQREGRVDRYGQPADTVYATTIYGKDNPTERLVLDILVHKIRSIHRDTGVHIVVPMAEQSMTDAILENLQQERQPGQQLSFLDDQITQQLEEATAKAQSTGSIFAHNRVKEHIVAECLHEVDEAIGHQGDVEHFVVQAASQLGAQLLPTEYGYRLSYLNLPRHLRRLFPNQAEWGQITFLSPPPEGHTYLGRNHPWVTLLCQEVLGRALDPPTASERMGRSAVLRTDAVTQRTLLVQFRIRNLIESTRALKATKAKHQLLSEEMYACGWETPTGRKISYAEAQHLLTQAQTRSNLSAQRQAYFFGQVEQEFEHYKDALQAIAEERGQHLVHQHNRFRELVGGTRYQAVTPVLPVDILGLYLLLPT